MDKRNKTEPFPPSIKPARVGVYEVWVDDKVTTAPGDVAHNLDFQGQFCYWNGQKWGHKAQSAALAATPYYAVCTGIQDKWWRGLAEDPVPRNPNWPAPAVAQ